MILDTNAISDRYEGTPGLMRHLATAARICLPIPALAEFRFGILKSNRRASMEEWYWKGVATSEVLPVDLQTAERYAQIRVILERKGRKIPMNDLWISAIALQHNLPVLSRDSHFDVVDGLKRFSW